MASADARAAAAVRPHGFSQSIGSPAAVTCAISALCWSVGAAISTPSIAAASSMSARLAYAAAPEPASSALAWYEISATAVTATRSEPASARTWVRPIRPNPATPSLKGVMSLPVRGVCELPAGSSMGLPRRKHSISAWQSAMSRLPSAPEVTGWLPVTMQS